MTDDRDEPTVDYSKDPRERTPIDPETVERKAALVDRRATIVEETTKNVVNAIQVLDRHVEAQLEKVTEVVAKNIGFVSRSMETVDAALSRIHTHVDDRLVQARATQRQTIAISAGGLLGVLFVLWWVTLHQSSFRQGQRDRLDEIIRIENDRLKTEQRRLSAGCSPQT